MITLKSNRLRIELASPGESPNTTFRFDRAGFISEVVLDGCVRFCATEPQNLNHLSSGGRGLCNEYTTDLSGEAAKGEYFPKFGVGLIRKEDDENFVIFKKYRDVELFPVHVNHSESQAHFITEALLCMGYAMKTEKIISLSENSLTMTVTAENTGEKNIALSEYCHNFLSIDGMAIGSDYQLDLPSLAIDLGNERLKYGSDPLGNYRGNGKGLTFCEMSPVATIYTIQGEEIIQKPPFVWELSHKGAKASVKCQEDFIPSKVSIWSVDHMVCPEAFFSYILKPGEKQTWKRVWTFSHRHE